MEIKGKRTPQAGRLFEVLQKTATAGGMAECGCCLKTRPAREFAYVESYEPRNAVIRKAMRADTVAAYAVCAECADTVPEADIFARCERMLINRGLLRDDHKPLNRPVRHTPRRAASEGPRIISNN